MCQIFSVRNKNYEIVKLKFFKTLYHKIFEALWQHKLLKKLINSNFVLWIFFQKRFILEKKKISEWKSGPIESNTCHCFYYFCDLGPFRSFFSLQLVSNRHIFLKNSRPTVSVCFSSHFCWPSLSWRYGFSSTEESGTWFNHEWVL